jgi:hypothetical protein
LNLHINLCNQFAIILLVHFARWFSLNQSSLAYSLFASNLKSVFYFCVCGYITSFISCDQQEAFVHVLGFVRVVVCASARYVTLLFLLIWHSSALALIFKEKIAPCVFIPHQAPQISDCKTERWSCIHLTITLFTTTHSTFVNFRELIKALFGKRRWGCEIYMLSYSTYMLAIL